MISDGECCVDYTGSAWLLSLMCPSLFGFPCQSRTPVYVTHNPAGTSVQNVVHWAQVRSGTVLSSCFLITLLLDGISHIFKYTSLSVFLLVWLSLFVSLSVSACLSLFVSLCLSLSVSLSLSLSLSLLSYPILSYPSWFIQNYLVCMITALPRII